MVVEGDRGAGTMGATSPFTEGLCFNINWMVLLPKCEDMKICHMDSTSVWQTRKPCHSIDILIRDHKYQIVPPTQWPWTSVFEAGIIEGQCHLYTRVASPEGGTQTYRLLPKSSSGCRWQCSAEQRE
jgi:hypothetical protein